jgi:hypothetical protein
MKMAMVGILAVVFVLTAVGTAMAKENAPSAEEIATEVVKPSVKSERTVTVVATVEAIDLEKRVVTLKGPKGKVFDIMAGDEVRNLAQVKVGDEVAVKYHESVAIDVRRPGKMPAGTKVAVVEERAKLGEKPAGIMSGSITVTATVEEIDAKNNRVTLKGSDGKSIFVAVKDPRSLDNVAIGDEVVITLTKSLAISVEGTK